MGYVRRVGIALDQLAHALIGGAPDATLSAVAHQRGTLDQRPRWRAARWIIDRMFFWEPNHCLEAWKAERDRTQYPADMAAALKTCGGDCANCPMGAPHE